MIDSQYLFWACVWKLFRVGRGWGPDCDKFMFAGYRKKLYICTEKYAPDIVYITDNVLFLYCTGAGIPL